jgi:hypothetical protein
MKLNVRRNALSNITSYALLEILHTHLGFIFPKVFPMFISHYSVSYSLGRIFL